MEPITDFYLFLLSVVLISLSGVMMPGPLFAMTITKGFRKKTAGILISLGHGVIEFPLILLIYFGFEQLFALSLTQKIIGLVGGLLMIYLGFRILKTERKRTDEREEPKHGSLLAGILLTGANPYFILWWATVGAALVMNAALFGVVGVLVFSVVHWLCDLVWNTFVTVMVFKSRSFWTQKVQNVVLGFCFVVLVGFGVWFIVSAVL